MVTAAIVCHDLDIHTLILRGVRATSLLKNTYLSDDIWAVCHGHFKWTFSARSCRVLKAHLLNLLADIGVEYYGGFNEWERECATCQGDECNIKLDIGDAECDW